jgi:NadR type nicotinamide-nucleotide adenylyltransferase
MNEPPSKPNGRTGFVVGKFLPPHRGHRHLIETARDAVDHLVVMLCYRPDDFVPGHVRAEWLREIHPDCEILPVPDTLADDSRLWAVFVRETLGYVPDVVFTSEDYGEPFAGYLGSRHVLVDRERLRFPVSGTAVRADPYARWRFLEPCVRAYFVKRVCVVGAESSGTTTLAQALAERFRTEWVPEYGREYSERVLDGQLSRAWTSEEFTHIASVQNAREDAAARRASRVLFCDTAAFATSVWHERYLDEPSPHVDALARECRYDLILLTDIDIPFVQDGLRDGETIRSWMHGRFVEVLTAGSAPWTIVSGPHEKRLAEAECLVEGLFG